MSNFLKRLGHDVRPYCKTLQGASYIPWALAVELAGYPDQETVVFEEGGVQKLARTLFGGAAVAVDHALPNGQKQRVYLPILDNKSYPVPFDQADGRDITDTINRCKARAVAMVDGLGLSLWSACEGDGPSYTDALALTPESDLRKAQEIRDIKEIKSRGPNPRVIRSTEYLGWHAALAAARITDENFHWEVVECDTVDEYGSPARLPALRAGGKGWIVGVRVIWRGKTHTEWLPIMGVAEVNTNRGAKMMEHQAIEDVTVFHWHSAVMRCLAKSIAMLTGYGIRCYAGDFGVRDEEDPEGQQRLGQDQQRPQQSSQQRQASQGHQRPSQDRGQGQQGAQGQQNTQQQKSNELGHEELVHQIRNHLKIVKCEESSFVSWLQVESLETAPDVKLKAGLASLNSRIKQQQNQAAKH